MLKFILTLPLCFFRKGLLKDIIHRLYSIIPLDLLTQSVFQAYNNSVGEVTEEAPIIQWFRGGASDEIPAMDPYHDRKRSPQR